MKPPIIRERALSRCDLSSLWCWLPLIFVAAWSWSPPLAVNSSQNNFNYSKDVSTPTISYNSTNNNSNNINNTSWLHSRFAQTNNSNNNNSSNRSAKLEAELASWTPRQRLNPAGGGYAIEVSPPPANMLFQYLPARSRREETDEPVPGQSGSPVAAVPVRGARMAATGAAVNYDDSDDEHNLIVTNTCERDYMLAEIKTSKPFYGVIHTLGYRHKLICTIEGDGGTYYKLSISYALNQNDPQHCGVARLNAAAKTAQPAAQASADSSRELLSAILAIRMHRNIELSDDKFFALNCTKRCRRPDCSSGAQLAIGRLVGELSGRQSSNGWRHLEVESTGDDSTDLIQSGQHGRSHLIKTAGDQRTSSDRGSGDEMCSIWRSAWLVALLLCLALVLIGVLISNCLICASLKGSEHDRIYRPRAGQSNGQLSLVNNDKKTDKFVQDLDRDRPVESGRERDSRRTTSRGKGRCIDYGDNNLNYFNHDDNYSGQQEQLKRSHRSHAAQLAGSTNTRQYR